MKTYIFKIPFRNSYTYFAKPKYCALCGTANKLFIMNKFYDSKIIMTNMSEVGLNF